MGDRANVAFKTDEDSTAHVWLYSHWGGFELPRMLLAAMKTRQAQARLSDNSVDGTRYTRVATVRIHYDDGKVGMSYFADVRPEEFQNRSKALNPRPETQ